MRTFAAFDISEETRRALHAAQKSMGRLNGVNWADTEGIHLTLKFIGEIEDAKIPAVFDAMKRAVAGVAPIGFAVKGLGWFPPGRRPRVIWAGIETEGEAMAGVVGRLEEGMAELGVPPEGRGFKPHLTLGRARGTIGPEELEAAFGRIARREFGRETAEELVLYMSKLLPSGAEYTRMGAVRLEGKE
jgi:2'-5' RNA ligase